MSPACKTPEPTGSLAALSVPLSAVGGSPSPRCCSSRCLEFTTWCLPCFLLASPPNTRSCLNCASDHFRFVWEGTVPPPQVGEWPLTILSRLQGLVVAVLYCFLNSEVSALSRLGGHSAPVGFPNVAPQPEGELRSSVRANPLPSLPAPFTKPVSPHQASSVALPQASSRKLPGRVVEKDPATLHGHCLAP